MSKKLFHPNRTGLNKALDQVEEVLEKLKERASHDTHHKEKDKSTRPVDAQTSTTSLCPGYKGTASATAKNTSVLISRSSSRLSKVSRRHGHKSNASKNKSQRSQVSEIEHSNPNKIRRTEQVRGDKNRHSAYNNPATRHSYRSGRGNTHDVENCLRDSSREILRNANSQEEIISAIGDRLWIPPLSQSSPREESTNRAKSYSKDLPYIAEPSHRNDDAVHPNACLPKEQILKVPVPFKATIPISGQSYAEPTLSFKLRTKLSDNKNKVEKENCLPYIPSGHTNKSHHVGVIMQQKLGLLKTNPPKELKVLTGPLNKIEARSETDSSDSIVITEEAITEALNNIQNHITAVRKLKKN